MGYQQDKNYMLLFIIKIRQTLNFVQYNSRYIPKVSFANWITILFVFLQVSFKHINTTVCLNWCRLTVPIRLNSFFVRRCPPLIIWSMIDRWLRRWGYTRSRTTRSERNEFLNFLTALNIIAAIVADFTNMNNIMIRPFYLKHIFPICSTITNTNSRGPYGDFLL